MTVYFCDEYLLLAAIVCIYNYSNFLCQVDAGLYMARTAHSALDPKLRGSVFTIQTQSRIYHLEADCDADMEKWVDAICRVCGLRATDERAIVMGKTFTINFGVVTYLCMI